MTDQLHFEAVIAIDATENQRAARPAGEQREAPLRRAGFGDGHAIGVDAVRAQGLRALIQRDFMLPPARALSCGAVKQKF